MLVTRTDRGVSLAAPITGTLYEGKAGSVHDDSDPLVYLDGPEYRTMDEVESIAKQLPGIPFTLLHPEGLIIEGAEADIIGRVVGGRVDNGYAVATIMVTSKRGLDAIEDGTFALSLGYRCYLDGDRFQRKVSVDHLALVPSGRCRSCDLRADACVHGGNDMKLGTMELEVKVTGLEKLDGLQECTCKNHAMPHNNGESMSDINTDTLTAEIEALKNKVTDLEVEATNARRDADKAKADLEASQAEITAAKAEVETAKAAAEEATTKVKADADEFLAKEMDARVNARVALILEASQFKLDGDVTKMSDREIKIAVIKHVDGLEVPAEKPDAFVDGVYHGAVKRGANAAESREAARVTINQSRQDMAAAAAAATGKSAEEVAKENMLRESAEAWAKKKSVR